MTQDKFDELLAQRIEKIHNSLAIKAKEYVRNDDPLHNFNVGANITGENPISILDGMMLKHYISYRDMLHDIENGQYPTREYILEKFGDLINYFILGEIIILEQLKDEDNKGVFATREEPVSSKL